MHSEYKKVAPNTLTISDAVYFCLNYYFEYKKICRVEIKFRMNRSAVPIS